MPVLTMDFTWRGLFRGFLLIALALAIFLLHGRSPVSQNGSDPRFSLYVTQSILDRRSIKLDTYLDASQNPADDHRIEQVNGHYYYSFPLGTSFFALPYVWVANRLGVVVNSPQAEDQLLDGLSALVSGLLFVVIFAIFGAFLSYWRSLVLATAFVLGTGLTSTLGTALWNLNFATMFVALAVLLLVWRETGRAFRFSPYALGFVLFAAYFTRPTTAIFIGLTLAYLLWGDRAFFVRTAAVSALCLTVFALFSYLEFGSWLPSYYQPGRLGGSDTPLPIVVYGLLFGPGRGLFVFSPLLLLTLVPALRYLPRSKERPLALFALAWIVLHTLVVMGFSHWWGGDSFGPRLLTDVLPGYVLLAAILWRRLSSAVKHRGQQALVAVYVLGAAASIYINSYAALFNEQTLLWNVMPPVDRAPRYLLDWRYPQFLATVTSNCQKDFEFNTEQMRQGRVALLPYEAGAELSYLHAVQQYRRLPHVASWNRPEEQLARASDGPDSQVPRHDLYLPFISGWPPVRGWFVGWVRAGSGAVHSQCDTAGVFFGPFVAGGNDDFTLDLVLRSTSPGLVTVMLNGELLNTLELNSDFQTYRLAVHRSALLESAYNHLEFVINVKDSSPRTKLHFRSAAFNQRQG